MTVKTIPYDSAKVLTTPEAIEEYLIAAFETADAAFIADALGVVARAQGITSIAAKTGLTRATLYKAFSDDGNPGFATVMKVMGSLGFTLTPKQLAPGPSVTA